MGDCMDPGNLPNHVAMLTKHSGLLRTILADGIEIVAQTLYERFVVKQYQLEKILNTAAQQPENGVSVLIAIIKGSQDHFDKFIQCLSDKGYTGLVEKLQGTGSAAVGTTDKAPRTITDNTLRLPTTPPGQFSIGKMDHYSLWTEEHRYLVEQFTNKQERIIGALFQHFIIDDDDKEEIRKERKQNCNADGARKLVEILGYRGKDAMPRIIKALATIQHDVSEHLQHRINEQTKL